MQIFLLYRLYKESISKEMNNDNDLNLHSKTKLLARGWLRCCTGNYFTNATYSEQFGNSELLRCFNYKKHFCHCVARDVVQNKFVVLQQCIIKI